MAQILLIEPDRLLAENYVQVLQHSGHNVTAASSAQSAILAADQAHPQLVILELQLVEHSGIEFLYEFRSYPEWQNVPVILQSQVPPTEFSASAQLLKGELGVRAYLYKPHTSLSQLVSAINEHLPIPA